MKRLGDFVASNFTVGVVTPFAAQAQLIERLAEERFGHSALDEADFVCGTAHRLQGDERDGIVVSADLPPEMPKTGARYSAIDHCGGSGLCSVPLFRTTPLA